MSEFPKVNKPDPTHQLLRPNADEDAEIARGIANDSDVAPDLSEPVVGIVRRPGRPPMSNLKD